MLGKDSFLGNRFFNFVNYNFNVLGTSRNTSTIDGYRVIYFDAYNSNSIFQILNEFQPNVVLNCVAITDVDYCEQNEEKCNQINNLLPSTLAYYTDLLGIKLVHISTDHYQSELNVPRTESSKVWAVNNYGKSKIEAENNIMLLNKDALIIRTNFFGFESNHKNTKLLSTVKSHLERGTVFPGFIDVVFSPVSINLLIQLIYKLIENNQKGIINVACNEAISKFKFAQLVAAALNISIENIVPERMSLQNHLSKRPNYLALDNFYLRQTLRTEITSLDAMIVDELSWYRL